MASANVDIVRRAIEANQPTSIVLNHLDYIDPALRDGARTAKARDFLSFVEAEISRKVDLVGLGPDSLVPRSEFDELRERQPTSRHRLRSV